MQIVVSARDANITNEMREYAERKVSKLPKYYDKIQEIEVVLSSDSAQRRAEIIVNAEHKNMFVASEKGPDILACVDLAVDKLVGQLTKHKDKHRNRKHPDIRSERAGQA